MYLVFVLLLKGMEDYQRTKKIMYKIGQWDPETKTIIHEPKESSTIYTGPISPQKADN